MVLLCQGSSALPHVAMLQLCMNVTQGLLVSLVCIQHANIPAGFPQDLCGMVHETALLVVVLCIMRGNMTFGSFDSTAMKSKRWTSNEYHLDKEAAKKTNL